MSCSCRLAIHNDTCKTPILALGSCGILHRYSWGIVNFLHLQNNTLFSGKLRLFLYWDAPYHRLRCNYCCMPVIHIILVQMGIRPPKSFRPGSPFYPGLPYVYFCGIVTGCFFTLFNCCFPQASKVGRPYSAMKCQVILSIHNFLTISSPGRSTGKLRCFLGRRLQ